MSSRLSISEGFIYSNQARFEEKMHHVLSDRTLADVHMLFDFDRTLTVRNPETHEDITTWHILKEHLPTDAQQVYQELFVKYRAMEIDGSMTNDHAAEWWSSILDLFVASKLNLKAVEADLLERATIRPGAAELFNVCREQNIPTVIMSAGIKDVIEMWNAVYKLNPTLVIAISLEINDLGRVIGWRKDSLVHALNKDEADHPELHAIRSKRPETILVGDGMGDKNMASGRDNVLRIRVLDPRPDEVIDIDKEREKTFMEFDAMIENGSLEPIDKLLAQAINLAS